MNLKALPAPAVLAVFLAASPAHAQLTLNLTSSAQNGSAGDTLHFTGTLSNPTAAAVFLNGDTLTFNAPATGLTLDDSSFVNNAPVSLTALGGGNDTYTGGFFDVTIRPAAAAGTYFGTFSILGGADGAAQATVASEDFSVTVTSTPVPEAPTPLSFGLLLALGLGGVAARRKVCSLCR